MSKGGGTQTQTTRLDPRSQSYLNQMRQYATQGAAGLQGQQLFTGPQTMSIGDQAAQFFNPYQQNVIDATRGQYDFMRDRAVMDVNQQAQQAGAFGGSRHGVAQGIELGELGRAEGQQIAGLQYQGYQNALQQGTAYAEQQRQLQQQKMQEDLFRWMQTLQGMNMGMGPTSGTTQTQMPSQSLWGQAAGLIPTVGSFFMPGAPSAPAPLSSSVPSTYPGQYGG